ncbi:putative acetylxylan esterase A [Colletotrichum spaethianum]|uniref:Acetylxylan esterase A n=1 Tax=Colletotrichum spaethianum TaxID=700344 RepID=A0AA37PEE7_9PEZI|nr:putative acetylxylan esterase A [Colletotrichum spaethianum]GKT50575.1 putative acetylxylan esterase A [Colletotrichum spaethianum]
MPSLTSTAALLALAATSTFALTSTSTKSDLDGSVWKALEGTSQPQSRAAFAGPQQRNRPTKRQSGWNPPSELSGALTEVWEHYEKTYDGSVFNNKNWGWDQVVANNGSLNICVRWDSTASVTAAQRTKIASVYAAQYQKWFKWVYGFDGFPYANVDVNIVGWAVRDEALLQGSTDDVDVYTSYKDGEGVPTCAPACDRAAHLNGDFSACKGGEGSHFDHSLWLTDGLEGGFGYDWGQQVGREYLLNNIDSGSVHILLHEMGHTFGLDDYWTPTGQSKFIMLAGSSMEITDFDGWMYRNWWYELSKNRGWTKSSSSNSGATASASASASAAPTVKEEAVASPTPAPVQTSAPIVADPETTAPAAAEPSAPAAGDSDAESGVTVARWGQCGGGGYAGTTVCAAGLTCVKTNEWYSQCL